MSGYTYKPLPYFMMTFIITFSCWFAGAYMSFQEHLASYYMLLMLPGLMAPFLLSLIMVFTSRDSALKREFINRLIDIRLIRPGLFAFFAILMPVTVLAAIVLSLPFGGSFSQLHFAEEFSFSTGFVPVLLLLFLAALFEELGWRGYAFDSLQSRYTFLTASIVFGILWSFWHFPLIFAKNSYQYEIYHQSFWYAVNFFAGIIPMGIIISWICVKNGKSVIAAVLFHFIINISQELFAITQNTKCIQTFVLTVCAAGLVLYDKELFFKKISLPSGTDGC